MLKLICQIRICICLYLEHWLNEYLVEVELHCNSVKCILIVFFVGRWALVLFTYCFSIAWSDPRGSVTEQWISYIRGVGVCVRMCARVHVLCVYERVYVSALRRTCMWVSRMLIERILYPL